MIMRSFQQEFQGERNVQTVDLAMGVGGGYDGRAGERVVRRAGRRRKWTGKVWRPVRLS